MWVFKIIVLFLYEHVTLMNDYIIDKETVIDIQFSHHAEQSRL